MTGTAPVDESKSLGAKSDLEVWKEVTRQTNVLLSKRLTLESYWTRNTRPDGRLFSQCRPLTLTKGVMRKTTHGSAMLSLGSTRVVIVGLVLQVGRIIVPGGGGDVNVNVNSVSSQSSSDTSCLSSWLERTLQETLDLQQLIISPSDAFSLQINIQILSESAGNLRDACLLAALAACDDTVLPETVTSEAHGKTTSSSHKPQQTLAGIRYLKPDAGELRKRTIQLPIVAVPLTLGLWNKNDESTNNTSLEWIVDPTQMELQHGCCGQLTVVVDAVTDRILQCDWASVTPMDHSLLALAVRMAQSRAQEMKPYFVSE